MKITDDEIVLAGRMLKVIRLASTPGMDEIAIKLNCGLTYDEKKRAECWARAFELAANAEKGTSLFDLAHQLNKEVS